MSLSPLEKFKLNEASQPGHLKPTLASSVSPVYGRKKSSSHTSGRRHNTGNDHQGSSAVHEDEGTWIFSYADMITILMMFFILLLSISSVDSKKFEKLKQSMKTESPEPQTQNRTVGSTVGTSGSLAVDASSERSTQTAVTKILKNAVETAESGGDYNAQLIAGIRAMMAALDTDSMRAEQKAYSGFEKLRTQLQSIEKTLAVNKKIQDEKKHEITLVLSSDAYFNKLSRLRPEQVQFFQNIAREILLLQPLPTVTISAHSSPSIHSGQIEALLMTSREALEVYLVFVASGIPRSQVSIAGFGTNQLIASEKDAYGNTDIAAQKRNRRLEVIIRRNKDLKTP